MQALVLSSFTLTTAAGCGNAENIASLRHRKTGLRPNNFLDIELETWIGRVADVEQCSLPNTLKNYQCRNNQLAYMALQNDNFSIQVEQAKKKYNPSRIGVFMGTSTSGILSTELAYQKINTTIENNVNFQKSVFFKEQHNSFALADFVQQYFQLTGPAQVISTACSSSAKVFASASQYIKLGLCDAAIVGGVDSLCLTTLYGFNSLELVAKDICRPADQNRQGLSIGEAAAFVLLEKPPAETSSNSERTIYLRGYGESSDAYHMSTPHPEGLGAIKAMQCALSQAQLKSEQVDYINLHGTATAINDQVEDIAIQKVFPQHTPCSSTKGWTGHTLGAAGAVEAIYSAFCIQNTIYPPSLNTQHIDRQFSSHIILADEQTSILSNQGSHNSNTKTSTKELHTIASNSFGFGGNNCCLIFSDSLDNSKQHSGDRT